VRPGRSRDRGRDAFGTSQLYIEEGRETRTYVVRKIVVL
jgi:hypothetical protein